MYNKNKPKSDSMMTDHGSTFFRVSCTTITIFLAVVSVHKLLSSHLAVAVKWLVGDHGPTNRIRLAFHQLFSPVVGTTTEGGWQDGLVQLSIETCAKNGEILSHTKANPQRMSRVCSRIPWSIFCTGNDTVLSSTWQRSPISGLVKGNKRQFMYTTNCGGALAWVLLRTYLLSLMAPMESNRHCCELLK